MNQDTAESRLARTLFVVEATSFEQLALWRESAHNSDQRMPRQKPLKWEQVNPGWLVTVGQVNRRPNCISVSWYRIEGQLIMFWYRCSQVTDSRQVDKWLAANFKGKYDKGMRDAYCDAMNFGHCLSAITEANRESV